MILTVIRGTETDIGLAGIAATALCGAGLTQVFDGGLPTRLAVAGGGSIEVQCQVADGPRVRAGFVRAGFDTIERLALPQIPPVVNLVSVGSGPSDKKYLQMADPAADALCGAGLTVAYGDGRSYSGDLFNDATLTVQCDSSNVAAVQRAFAAVWQLLQNP